MDRFPSSDEISENCNTNTDTLNITDYTATISNIEHLGKNPDHWLLALRHLEEIEEGPRKRKLLKHFFAQSGKVLDSVALRQNRGYAMLLGKEALFHSKIDAEDARSMFEMALTLCQKSSVLYLMFAQFELDQGRKNKALKILRHGEVCIGNSPEITGAKIKVEQGIKRIYGGIEPQQNSPMKEITNNGKNTSIQAALKLPMPSVPSKDKENYDNNKARTLHASDAVVTTPGIKENTESTGNFQIEKKNFQTPPPFKIGNIDLNLDLQSPVFPDSSLTLIKKRRPVPASNLAKDAHFNSQSLSSSDHNVLNVTSDPNDSQSAIVAPQAAKSAIMWSEKKQSPVSRAITKNCQTTGKKPSRMPMRVPRRVLIQSESCNTNCVEDANFDDVKPIEKSPENVKPNDSVETEASKNFQRISSDLSAFHHYNGGPIVTNSLQQSDNAVLIHEKHDIISPPSQLKHHTTSLHSRENHQAKASIPLSQSANQIISNIQSEAVNSRDNKDLYSTFVPNHIPQPVQQSKSNFPENRHGRFVSQSMSEYQVHQGPLMVHPAHRMMQEKKIMEINGKPYILLKLLGKGGSSKVYQALNPANCEISAIKQVNLVGCEPSVLESYKNEIQFLKKLQGNRHIIRLLDYEIRENHLYLVMECGSLDLSAFLKKQKADNVENDVIQILAFWKNMLKAVDTIHKHGIIHLDLKPANFMLVNYTLKLIDFGIANSIQVDATSIIKDTQFGTLNYMAPETINDQSGGCQSASSHTPKFRVGPKADVWSLGCILYYIMYGKTPFQHIHHHMKLFAIINENHNIEFPDFPQKQLIEIVKACLIRDTKKRPSVEMLLKHPLLN